MKSRIDYAVLVGEKTGITRTPANWEAPWLARSETGAFLCKTKKQAMKALRGLSVSNPPAIDLAIWALMGYKIFSGSSVFPGINAMKNPGKEIICYGQVNQGRWCQEWYETSSKDAGIRARLLRKMGYKVVSQSMGSQVTPVGVVKMTLVDIRPGIHPDTMDLPPVQVERI